jgi:ATPase subunit of ABC transporter with duplicated ATPase domains
MYAIVELTSLGATSYGGGWELYRERKALELAAAEHGLATAERQVADIRRRNQAQAERKAHRDATGKRKASKGGMPRIVTGGMKRAAEQSSGAAVRLADRLSEEAAEQAAEARGKIEILQPLTVKLAPSGLAPSREVLRAGALCGGPPDRPGLIDGFDLAIIGPERIAITGPNGSGKTTLLRLLTGELAASGGAVELRVRWALLDQSVSLLDPDETIRENYRRLNPADDENACRAALARFKFRAEAALQVVRTLSGGEMLRAGFAATIGASTPPELLILDEPTNHLDLDAIAAVEAGLSAYDGALLVVSHDRDFLAAIGVQREIVLTAAQR